MRWSSHQGQKTIETTGLWLFGGLTMLLALGKVIGLWGWSWGRVALPMLIFLVFNVLYTYCISRRNFFGGKQLRVL